MNYKIGNKVRIKSLDWYKKNKDKKYGSIYVGSRFPFWKNMAKYCGTVMKIAVVKVDPEDSNKCHYLMENCEERWANGMIEGLVLEPQEKMVSLNKVCDMLHAMLITQDINNCDYVTAPAYNNVVDFVNDFCEVMEV